jgi:phosphotransferase system HPr (HPr) family protein
VTDAGQASVELAVEHEHGLHLRPAAEFVRLAARFRSRVAVVNVTRGGGRTADARSLLQVTALGVNAGHVVRLTATGDDAAEALDALTALIRGGFASGSGGA